ARKTPLALRHRKGAAVNAGVPFKDPNIGLVIAQALMLGGEFRPGLDAHPGFLGQVDRGLIQALGVHLEFYRAADCGERLEHRLPETIATLRNAALAMHAQCDTCYLSTP